MLLNGLWPPRARRKPSGRTACAQSLPAGGARTRFCTRSCLGGFRAPSGSKAFRTAQRGGGGKRRSYARFATTPRAASCKPWSRQRPPPPRPPAHLLLARPVRCPPGADVVRRGGARRSRHNNRSAEILATVRRGPFAKPWPPFRQYEQLANRDDEIRHANLAM